jgi:hypothetical protein
MFEHENLLGVSGRLAAGTAALAVKYFQSRFAAAPELDVRQAVA